MNDLAFGWRNRNLHVSDHSGDGMEDGAERRRPWLVLFLVGVALHAYAAHNSDLGLDAHVRLNVVNDETNPGFDAPWGAPRVSGDASEPSAASFDGYVPPWNTCLLYTSPSPRDY